MPSAKLAIWMQSQHLQVLLPARRALEKSRALFFCSGTEKRDRELCSVSSICFKLQFNLRSNLFIQAGAAGINQVFSGLNHLLPGILHIDLQVAGVTGEDGVRTLSGRESVKTFKTNEPAQRVPRFGG